MYSCVHHSGHTLAATSPTCVYHFTPAVFMNIHHVTVAHAVCSCVPSCVHAHAGSIVGSTMPSILPVSMPPWGKRQELCLAKQVKWVYSNRSPDYSVAKPFLETRLHPGDLKNLKGYMGYMKAAVKKKNLKVSHKHNAYLQRWFDDHQDVEFESRKWKQTCARAHKAKVAMQRYIIAKLACRFITSRFGSLLVCYG